MHKTKKARYDPRFFFCQVSNICVTFSLPLVKLNIKKNSILSHKQNTGTLFALHRHEILFLIKSVYEPIVGDISCL